MEVWLWMEKIESLLPAQRRIVIMFKSYGLLEELLSQPLTLTILDLNGLAVWLSLVIFMLLLSTLEMIVLRSIGTGKRIRVLLYFSRIGATVPC